MEKSESQSRYLPGLHGLRALAAGAVVLQHIGDRLQEAAGLPHYGHTPGHKFAVTVFFTLSGFLITYLLLLEKENTGKISITQFYIRRTLRIWPLYFMALGAALLYNALTHTPYDTSLIVIYALFATNFSASFNAQIPNAAHLWSLGVEEQFYLLWPWMIRFSRKPIYLLSGFLILFVVVKILLFFLCGRVSPAFVFFHITRFDCMAIGGIGAWVYWKGIPASLKNLLFAIPMQLCCWLALIFTVFTKFHRYDLLDHTAVGVVTIVLILNLVANPKPLLRIENRFWRFMGGISFGIYIWHPLIESSMLKILPSLPFGSVGKLIFFYATVSAGTVLVAHLSMKYFETPFLKLKDRFHHKTGG